MGKKRIGARVWPRTKIVVNSHLKSWIAASLFLAILMLVEGMTTRTGHAFAQSTRIDHVIDGDTIRVRFRDGSRELVRLIGIDAPELHHSEKLEKQARNAHVDTKSIIQLGERSAQVARSLMPKGSEIRLEYDVVRRDKYGRLLCYAYLPDSTFVNKELILRGFAHLTTYPPNVSKVDELRVAYADARAGGRGLWASAGFAEQENLPKPKKKRFPDASRRVYEWPAGRVQDRR
jgi:micrococcal nuclease